MLNMATLTSIAPSATASVSRSWQFGYASELTIDAMVTIATN